LTGDKKSVSYRVNAAVDLSFLKRDRERFWSKTFLKRSCKRPGAVKVCLTFIGQERHHLRNGNKGPERCNVLERIEENLSWPVHASETNDKL